MNGREERIERRLEIPLIVAAILTLPFLLLQDGSAHGNWHAVGYFGSMVIWGLFLVEIVIMLAVAEKRWRWLIDHPLDVAIVVLTPPFLFGALQGLRVLRVLRLLRLFRVAPFLRRLFSPEGLRYVALMALLVLLIGAEAFSTAENVSFGTAIYWAITTMTTVGYGDVTPHTTVGRIVACIVMVVGIGFFAVLTGAIAQQFLSTEVAALDVEERDLVAQIREIGAQLKELEELALRQAKHAGERQERVDV